MKTSIKNFRKYIAQVGEIDKIMLDISKAEGIYQWDTSGKKYIDLLSGICVANIGHKNPRVVAAMKNQMDKYLHSMVYGEFVQQLQYNYARLLIRHLPPPFKKIFYVNSGSEAIEGAIKTAKIYTKRKEIIACFNSYHGSTLGAVSLISGKEYREKFLPLIDCKFIHFNNENDLEKITEKTACIVIEPIQAGAGVILPENNYIKKLRKRCNEVGCLLIFDEIQTGFYRTGKFFAFEHFDIVPDILCIAKAMGGGMPVGAFVSSEEIMNSLDNHHPLIGHATTFGGNPVCLAAALEVLKILFYSPITKDVESKGMIYRNELKHKNIKEVRGLGLFNCIELKDHSKWQKALTACFKNGIITGTHLFNEGCLSVKPPLIIRKNEIYLSIEKIHRALDSL